jgi:hypothetical protein
LLNFLLRVMIVFGAGFLVPVFVLGLNFLGILKARHLAKARRFVIFGCFVFGAVATPQTDPFSMLALAIPMTLLYLAADLIAHIHDRRASDRSTEPTPASESPTTPPSNNSAPPTVTPALPTRASPHHRPRQRSQRRPSPTSWACPRTTTADTAGSSKTQPLGTTLKAPPPPASVNPEIVAGCC